MQTTFSARLRRLTLLAAVSALSAVVLAGGAQGARAAMPTVTSFSPTSGPVGTTVTIKGLGFTGVTDVQFHLTDAAMFTPKNDKQLSAVVGAGSTTGTVSVTTPGGTGTSVASFTVTPSPIPTLKSFSPASGVAGTTVTIKGTGFLGASDVTFGGMDAASFKVTSATQISAVVSADATTGKVAVTTPGGVATSTGNFTITPPTVSSFTPTSGLGATTVVIKGNAFVGVTDVEFNGTPAQDYNVDSAKQITATVDDGTESGRVTVTTPGGVGRSAKDFVVPLTMNINYSGQDFGSLDPALAYNTPTWQVEYATCAKLLNYEDADGNAALVPEVATGLPTVSPDGLTYTFTIGTGFKFSDGTPVTAANFAYAINRDLNPVLVSSAQFFLNDIGGAQAVINGTAKTASGVVANGNTLTITLVDPKADFLAILALPFVCAIPTKTKTTAAGVVTLPGAGPYYIASHTIGQQVVLKRNPYYTGPRPHHVETFVITFNTNVDQSLQQVKDGSADYDMYGLPPSAIGDLATDYGVNTAQFWVNPMLETDYVALNTTRTAFSHLNLRKAANYAIDRPAMIALRGDYAGTATDQILPPGTPGFSDVDLYPLAGPDLTTANTLAAGDCGTVGTIQLWAGNSTIGTAQAAEVKSDLEGIGCTVNVTLRSDLYTAAGTQGAAFDAVIVGWAADYPDPADFIDILLNGEHIRATNNNNLAYLNNAAVNQAIDDANALAGSARNDAFGALDESIMENQAPWIPIDNRNTRSFVSARVGDFVFSASYGPDLAAFTITP